MSNKETYVEHSSLFPLQLAVFSYAAPLIPISQDYVQNTHTHKKKKKSQVQKVSENRSSVTEKSVITSTLEFIDFLYGSLYNSPKLRHCIILP